MIDLSGQGFDVDAWGSAPFNVYGTGFEYDMGWIGPSSAFLVIDLNSDGSFGAGDGTITSPEELIFARWLEGATSDMQALAEARDGNGNLIFDSNGDGVLSADDTLWANFRLWNDLNGNGQTDAGEMQTLDALGFTEIGLTYTCGCPWGPSSSGFDTENGTVYGTANAVRDGQVVVGAVADAVFTVSNTGYRIVETQIGYDLESSDGTVAHVWVADIVGNSTADAAQMVADIFIGPESGGTIIASGRSTGVTFVTTGGTNTFIGSDGDDTLFLHAGADLNSGAFVGGLGIDTLIFHEDTAVNLNNLTGTGFENIITGNLDAYVNLSNSTFFVSIVGKGGNDTLTGGMAGNILLGGGGDDIITGGAGQDMIVGGAGNNILNAGAGDDIIQHIDGHDTLLGNTSNTGFDTLSLASFNRDEVSFRIVGNDVVISTVAGTSIRLVDQLRYESGHNNTNIEKLVFQDGFGDFETIHARALADQINEDGGTIQGSSLADIIGTGYGNDTISAGAGDDVIVYHSGNDLIRGDNGAINSGFDTLDLSQYTAADVSFRVSGHDVLVTTPDGTIRLEYQVRYELEHARSNVEEIIFSDGSLNEAGIKGRALSDQATAGNDVITGTIQDDQIRGLAGNDTLVAGGGNDTIYFDSGDDVIVGHATVNVGHDTLDLSQYAASDVSFRVSGYDVVITAPHGTIRLEYQVRYELGHTRSNIEEIIFSDGSLDEAGIKGRALSDQATAGNDVITGTIQSDVLDGGAGNDTITGGAGADVFIFGLGSGQDRITDFSLTEDLIRFNGHVFSDLTITQSGANTLVALGVEDVITLAGITASNITTDHFEFI